MSILGGLELYKGSYEETGRTNFSDEDINAVDKAEVKSSKFGLSACFFMKSGGKTFIPLAQDVVANEGDVIDMKSVEILTLSRAGDSDILRVSF